MDGIFHTSLVEENVEEKVIEKRKGEADVVILQK